MMRVAIVSDGIWVYGGAERVLQSLIELYPSADLYALVDTLPQNARGWLRGRPINTSFVQRLPGSRRYFRKVLSLWPIAIEQFDLSGYDLVISSHFAVSHGVITGPSQVHVTYTHSPMRYAWDLQWQYLREANLHRGLKTVLVREMLHRLRVWDTIAAARVDEFAANSAFVAARIKRYYRRNSSIIYPPVYVDRFTFNPTKDDYYLYLGRLVAYKRVDIMVDAFAAMPDRKLIIAGEGPLLKSLQARATPNVQIIGPVEASRADTLMGGAKAYIHAAIEDFGIAPVEAQAAGTPVIGLGIGGLCETICGLTADRPTGLFFGEQTVEALRNAIEKFEQLNKDISPLDCRANAVRFAPEAFQAGFRNFVQESLRKHGSNLPEIDFGTLMCGRDTTSCHCAE